MSRWMFLRRLSLAGSGATFGAIAILAAVAPVPVARAYGLTIDGVDAANQFRAVFTGFWAGLALWMIIASRPSQPRLLGDLAGVAILLQGLARAFSLVADGVPSERFVLAMGGEIVAALAILLPPRLR